MPIVFFSVLVIMFSGRCVQNLLFSLLVVEEEAFQSVSSAAVPDVGSDEEEEVRIEVALCSTFLFSFFFRLILIERPGFYIKVFFYSDGDEVILN